MVSLTLSSLFSPDENVQLALGVSWKCLMGRTCFALSFGMARCIGSVRTMIILAHLICLKSLCDDMFRYCKDNAYIIVIMIYRSYILILGDAFYRTLSFRDFVLKLWIGYCGGRKTTAIQTVFG